MSYPQLNQGVQIDSNSLMKLWCMYIPVPVESQGARIEQKTRGVDGIE